MDVSIIIINYNTKDLIINCLKSIYEKTHNIGFEIIVVDNNSSDGSQEAIKKNFVDVILIENNENIGFGRANNIGYEAANGKYIFLLNSDTYLLNNAIKSFYDTFEQLPNDVSCLGSLLLNEDRKFVRSFGNFIILKRLIKSSFLTLMNKKKSYLDSQMLSSLKLPFEVEVVIGADLFIRRNVIEKLGFFDPRFFMYHEENDLQRRFYNSGYKQFIIDGPKIVHLEGKSSKKMNTLIIEGTFIYLKKWENRFLYYLYRIMYGIGHLPIIFKLNIAWSLRKKYLAVCFYKVKNN